MEAKTYTTLGADAAAAHDRSALSIYCADGTLDLRERVRRLSAQLASALKREQIQWDAINFAAYALAAEGKDPAEVTQSLNACMEKVASLACRDEIEQRESLRVQATLGGEGLRRNDAYYYGCWPKHGEKGHYWWDQSHWNPRIEMICRAEGSGKYLSAIDGGFAPRVSIAERRDAAEYPQGLAVCTVLPPLDTTHSDHMPWTLLSFWDRTGDARPGSNTNFLLRGERTFDQCVVAAKATFPAIWERFTFPVTERGALDVAERNTDARLD